MWKFITIFIISFVLCFGEQCSAQVKTFHAESFYVMNRGESIKVAQEKVFNDAVRMISEEAGVIVKSFSQTKNAELTSDEIETLTASVLRIKSKIFGKKFTTDGELEISVFVDSEVDTENVDKLLKELSASQRSKENYEKILANYTRHQEQFDTVYSEYLSSYEKRIMRKIHEGCKLQNDEKLDDAFKLYDEAIDESVAEGKEFSIAYIKRGNVYKFQGKENLAILDFKKAIALNNDVVGIHFAKAILSEAIGDKNRAAQEYLAFVKDASIVYYDTEIIEALDRIINLEELR